MCEPIAISGFRQGEVSYTREKTILETVGKIFQFGKLLIFSHFAHSSDRSGFEIWVTSSDGHQYLSAKMQVSFSPIIF
ncbi:MAG: hypothetical protein ACJAYN_003242 [Bermanella sp.]